MSLDYEYDGTTPTLAEIIRAAVRNQERSSFTALPGRITSYDAARMCASAQPVVKGGGGEKPSFNLPPLVCMPVVFPGGGEFSITWPVSPGDGCLIVFSSVSASQWLTSGEDGAEPESPRRQSLSDGIIIPGLRSFVDPIPAAAIPNVMTIGTATSTITIDSLTGIVTITAGSTVITITPGGAVAISGGGFSVAPNAGATAIGGASVALGNAPSDFVALAGLVSANLAAIAVVLNALSPGSYTPTPVAASSTTAT